MAGNHKQMPNEAKSHQPTEYVFELIVGGKSAKSGILEVKEEIICLRLIGMHFDTNKNFLLPDAMKGIQSLIDIYKQHPDSELLVVGHTDRSGSPSYNDPLSVERADAVAAFLTDDVDAWLARYKTSVSSEKRWGTIEDNHMLESLADFPTKPATQSTVEWFQETRGLGVDNDAGPETRRQLITEYMAHDKTTLPAGIEMVTHGCGENFPLDEAGEIDTNAPDGEKDDKDRRVEIFVFDPPGIRPKPKGKNSKKGSKEYPEWRRRTTEIYDFRVKSQKKWPVNIKGKLFWNRTWDYNDETKPIGAIKEFLPGAKADLHILEKGSKAMSKHKSIHLTDDGEFAYNNVPECTKAAIRIFLEYRSGKVVSAKGKSNHVSQPDFEIKTGKVIWHQLELDMSSIDGNTKDVDLGDVEIKKAHFVDVCDAYKSVWFGHKRIKELAGHDLPICQINYPEPTTSTSNASSQMQLLKDDLKDRDVILHEYGHFIGHHVLGGLTHPGYDYNDDIAGQHGRTTKEHYESAWNEGHATFLSCALTDDPHYHDGYDASLNQHLDKDNTTVGPHSEGSIQEALWRIYKVHKTSFKNGFWKAFTNNSKRKVETIFDFFDNWKDLGLSDLDKVVESFKKFNMEYGYKYLDGTDMYEATSKLKKLDKKNKQFRTLGQLYRDFGKIGKGTKDEYKEEFYNRNKRFNKGALAAGSSPTNPKLTVGKKYIVPVRFQVKA